MSRRVRIAGTIALTAACTAYLLWKIDLGRTGAILADADPRYFLAGLAIWTATFVPNAWRWQMLLAARDVHDRLGWLTRVYFVSYAVGQLFPTSVGGDAVRMYEGARRHPGRGGDVAGSVVVERVLGGIATLALAGLGFALAAGRYDVRAYLWIEAALAVAAAGLAFVLFSRTARVALAVVTAPLAGRWLDRPLRSVYDGIHAYRSNPSLLVRVTVLSVLIQAFGILAMWCCGKAVGIDLSPRPYYVLGPMLFLIMLIPFTINGIAVRESFFVSFLGNLGVAADAAFAAGFLYFVIFVSAAIPGGVMLAWPAVRGRRDEMPHRLGKAAGEHHATKQPD